MMTPELFDRRLVHSLKVIVEGDVLENDKPRLDRLISKSNHNNHYLSRIHFLGYVLSPFPDPSYSIYVPLKYMRMTEQRILLTIKSSSFNNTVIVLSDQKKGTLVQ